MKSLSLLAIMVLGVALFVWEAEAACVPAQLSPCLPAISKGESPSQICCQRLKEQQPCYCQYLKDPNLRKYIDSPNAKKVSQACGVTYPKC